MTDPRPTTKPTPTELKIVRAFRAGFTEYLERTGYGGAKDHEEHYFFEPVQ